MHCPKCLEQGEHRVFSTFEYWYCAQCRAEIVAEQTEPPSLHEALFAGGVREQILSARTGYTLKLPGSGTMWMHIPGTDVYESDLGTQWSESELLPIFGAVPQ